MTRDDLWYAWFSGIVDLRGCFEISTTGPRGQYLAKFSMRFGVKDNDVLDQILSNLRFGSMTKVKKRYLITGDVKNSPRRKWVVQSLEDCKSLCVILDKFELKTRKIVEYLTWREAVMLRSKSGGGRKWTTKMKESFSLLGDSLKAHRSGSRFAT